MIVLGIDPGLAITGYALVREKPNGSELIAHGCLRTAANTPQPERLKQLYQGAQELISKYEVTEVAIEQLFFNTNVTTALAVGQARGVLILCAAQLNLPVWEYTPLQVKQAVAGYGRADKGQMQRMVQSHLKLEQILKPDDAADAAAVAICHLQSYKYNRAIARR